MVERERGCYVRGGGGRRRPMVERRPYLSFFYSLVLKPKERESPGGGQRDKT